MLSQVYLQLNSRNVMDVIVTVNSSYLLNNHLTQYAVS